MTPAPGIYRNAPFAEYAAWDACNHSRLTDLERSAKYMRYRIDQPDEDTAAILMGRALHTTILEPHLFDNEYIISRPCVAVTGKGIVCGCPGKYWNDGKWLCGKHADASNTDATILTADQGQAVEQMAKAVMTNEWANRILSVADARELSFVWNDPATGVLCKGRADLLLNAHADATADIKTTTDCSPEEFERVIMYRHYYRQASHYLDGLTALGKPRSSHFIIAVENEAPWDVAVYQLRPVDIAIGQCELHGPRVDLRGKPARGLIEMYRDAMASPGEPAGCGTEIRYLGLPAWRERQAMHGMKST